MFMYWKSWLTLSIMVGAFYSPSALANTTDETTSENFSRSESVRFDLEKDSFSSSFDSLEISQGEVLWEDRKTEDLFSCNTNESGCPEKQPTPPVTPETPATDSETPTETSDLCSQPIEPFTPIVTPEAPTEVSEVESSGDQPEVSSGDQPEVSAEDKPEPEKKPVSHIPQPTPEELAQYEKIALADQHYRCGETVLAEQLYREVKPPFQAETSLNRQLIPEPIYDPENLQPGGAVYWRLYQEGKAEKTYQSKILIPLKLLTEQYPEFIPGHITYAEVLKEFNQPEQARKVLEEGVSLYPNEAPLVFAAVKADEAENKWLEASLIARRFALFNPEHFRAEEFRQIADQDLAKYKSALNSKLTWNAVGNAVLGGLGYALLGNLGGPISAIETTMLLIQGESAVGDKFSQQLQKQLPLLQDEEVLTYVRSIGAKVAALSGRNEFNYEFFVVMDENINAFALPGGKIFINAGAILKTNSEAELAGLIAHEISHAVLSHGFQLMTQGNLIANTTQFIPYLGSGAADLIVLNYSREMEQQADIFGTRLLAASGYSADGVRNLMVILDNQDKGSPAIWLSTHPETSDRVEYIEEFIVKQQFNRYAYEGVENHWRIRQKTGQLLDQYLEEKKKKGKKSRTR